MTSIPSLDVMLTKLKRYPPTPQYLLCFDPGETTGWAVVCWNRPFDSQSTACGQLATPTIEKATPQYNELIYKYQPDILVVEEYRVYSWKSDQHKWSDVITLRLIGCLETLSYLRQVPLYKQMAGEAKDFVTDEKLKAWGLHEKGQRHARDAMRHACSFMLFNKNVPPTS